MVLVLLLLNTQSATSSLGDLPSAACCANSHHAFPVTVRIKRDSVPCFDLHPHHAAPATFSSLTSCEVKI